LACWRFTTPGLGNLTQGQGSRHLKLAWSGEATFSILVSVIGRIADDFLMIIEGFSDTLK